MENEIFSTILEYTLGIGKSFVKFTYNDVRLLDYRDIFYETRKKG